jgi:dTDP-4-dehydrorhamnose reductase
LTHRVLVVGAGGMLGHKMLQTLSGRFEQTFATIRGGRRQHPYDRIDLFQTERVLEHVDLLQLDELDALLESLRPDVVVNCAGIVKQRAEAHDAISSITINALLPHRIARTVGQWDGRLIHFSTDCIFSGKRGRYTEADFPDACDLYGRSKFLGEVESPHALTLRTSIIGRELQHFESLLEWFLRQSNPSVRGFTRAFWSGVTTNHLAELVTHIIRSQPQLRGVYQISSGRIAKYDLLLMLRSAYGMTVEIEPDDTMVCDRSLDGRLFEKVTGYCCPPLNEMIQQMAADPTPYSEWLEANAVARR